MKSLMPNYKQLQDLEHVLHTQISSAQEISELYQEIKHQGAPPVQKVYFLIAAARRPSIQAFLPKCYARETKDGESYPITDADQKVLKAIPSKITDADIEKILNQAVSFENTLEQICQKDTQTTQEPFCPESLRDVFYQATNTNTDRPSKNLKIEKFMLGWAAVRMKLSCLTPDEVSGARTHFNNDQSPKNKTWNRALFDIINLYHNSQKTTKTTNLDMLDNRLNNQRAPEQDIRIRALG